VSQPARLHQPGETREAAITNIKDAIAEYIESLRDDGEPVPEDNFAAMIVAV
jgi:predicted RNase H-like HicB family nuclease